MPVVLLAVFAAVAAPPAPDDARRDALTRFGVGVLRARDDRPVEAVRQFETAARQDPSAAEPLRHLVGLYRDLGRDPAAIRTAEAVLRLDPDDADTAHTLGEMLYEAKRFAEAADRLKQAARSPRLTDQPEKRLGILRDLSRACERADDPAGAESALREALTLTTDPKQAGAIREKLGQALAARKQLNEAETMFREAARSGNAQATAKLEWHLSELADGRGDHRAAVEHLTRYLALKPTGTEPYERLAKLMALAGRQAEVAPTLARMAERNPAIPAIRWVYVAEVGRTNPITADAQFRQLAPTTADPAFYRLVVRFYREAERPDLLLTLIDGLYRDSRPAEGKAALPADPAQLDRARAITTAVRADQAAGRMLVNQVGVFANPLPANLQYTDDTWELLVGLAERAGRLDLAEDAARQLWANRMLPRMGGWGRRNADTTGFNRLYQILVRQRNWASALELCDEAERNPNFTLDHLRAIPLAELGREREALAAIDRYINFPNSNKFSGRLDKARVLNILDRHRDAVELCRALFPEAATATDARRVRYVLSEALLGVRDHAGAEAVLRSALDDDPDDVVALNNLGYNLADQGRKLDEAEALIRRAIQIDRDGRARAGDPDPESGVYLDSLGWVLFRKGKWSEARQALETAAGMPDGAADPIVWDHLGDAAFRQGDSALAREAWTKALGLYANSHQGRQAGRRVEAERKLKLLP